LDDTKPYHQLIIKIATSEKRRTPRYERKGKFAELRLNMSTKELIWTVGMKICAIGLKKSLLSSKI